jgi:low temperature requirement protein LtrA
VLWWGWTQFTWTANAVDLRSTKTRIAFFVAMGAAIVIAVSVPSAFGEGGVWFVAGYVAVRAIGVWLHVTETTDPVVRASARFFAAVSWVGPLVLLIGAFVDPPARSWIWLAGLLLEVAAAGVAGRSAWHMRAEHFAERHGLIYIIALGEGIVAVGIVATAFDLDPVLLATVLLGVAAAAALWWSYFDGFSPFVEDRLRRAGKEQGSFARDAYSLGHYPMIAGSCSSPPRRRRSCCILEIRSASSPDCSSRCPSHSRGSRRPPSWRGRADLFSENACSPSRSSCC